MAAVTGRAAGFIATLYRYALDTTKTETTVEAALVAANKVKDVSDMGAFSKERDIIDIPVYGADVAGKLPGQADPGTFDFTVTLDMNNALHKALRDDNGKTEFTWIVEYTQSTDNKTYGVFDGFVATADINQPVDGAITMDCSVARSGAITWIDNS